MVEELNIKNLDHLGLIAGIIDDLNIEKIVNSLIKTDNREKVSAGTIVKAIILNNCIRKKKVWQIYNCNKCNE